MLGSSYHGCPGANEELYQRGAGSLGHTSVAAGRYRNPVAPFHTIPNTLKHTLSCNTLFDVYMYPVMFCLNLAKQIDQESIQLLIMGPTLKKMIGGMNRPLMGASNKVSLVPTVSRS